MEFHSVNKKTEIAKKYLAELEAADAITHKISEGGLFFHVFKYIDSLELTAHGLQLMSRIRTPHTFTNTTPRTGEILLQLDQALDIPYYISDGKIVLFDDTQAAILTLHDDLKSFLGL